MIALTISLGNLKNCDRNHAYVAPHCFFFGLFYIYVPEVFFFKKYCKHDFNTVLVIEHLSDSGLRRHHRIKKKKMFAAELGLTLSCHSLSLLSDKMCLIVVNTGGPLSCRI